MECKFNLLGVAYQVAKLHHRIVNDQIPLLQWTAIAGFNDNDTQTRGKKQPHCRGVIHEIRAGCVPATRNSKSRKFDIHRKTSVEVVILFNVVSKKYCYFCGPPHNGLLMFFLECDLSGEMKWMEKPFFLNRLRLRFSQTVGVRGDSRCFRCCWLICERCRSSIF